FQRSAHSEYLVFIQTMGRVATAFLLLPNKRRLECALESILSNLFHIVLAWILVLPVALDRERNTKIMGLRTFPLVALGTCAFIRVALGFVGDAPDPKARIIQALVTGISFIGAGAIIKDGSNTVRGTASAASIWTVVA